jgi:hypothetical protein
MDRTLYGNPEASIGDSAFQAMGRYLAAKKEGVNPDPEDWEEISENADDNTMQALAEPSEKIYAEYAKVYKGFLQEICRKTFTATMDDDSEDGKDVASALRYEIDRMKRQGKPGTKSQLKEVLEKNENYLNLPINNTTISALASWLKAILREDRKAQKKVDKLKAAAQELVQTVQADQDQNAMRRLILREMVQKGDITQDQMTLLCERLMLNETVEVG